MKKLLLAAAALAVASPAMAATDGALSTTSSVGSVDVTVNIPEMVRVSGLDDMVMDITPAALTNQFSNNVTVADSFCVYSNDGPDGDYAISVAATPSGGGSGPYSLTGPESLNYQIYLGDVQSGGASFQYQFPGNVETFSSAADGLGRRTTLDCSAQGNNAIIRFRVMSADAIAAQAGTYTDTITVTVAVI